MTETNTSILLIEILCVTLLYSNHNQIVFSNSQREYNKVSGGGSFNSLCGALGNCHTAGFQSRNLNKIRKLKQHLIGI